MKRFLAQYAYNILLGLDQFLNILLLGDPDESISGRTGRAMASGRQKWFVRPLQRAIDASATLLVGEVEHCKNAHEHEEMADKELWSWIKG